MIPSRREGTIHEAAVVGPFRDDINVVDRPTRMASVDTLQKRLKTSRGKAFKYVKKFERFVMRLVS